MIFSKKFAILVIALILTAVLAQPPRPNARGRRRAAGRRVLRPIAPGSRPERARGRVVCSSVFRTINGVCTNPFFKLWGSTNRAQSSLFFARSSEFPTGGDLPSARFVSNALLQQTTTATNDRDINELFVFFGQFIDHTFAATPLSDEEMPIEIPEDDPIMANFTNGELGFRRSERTRLDLTGLFGSAASSLAKTLPRVLDASPRIRRRPGIATSFPSSLRATIAPEPRSFTARQSAGDEPSPTDIAGGEDPDDAPRMSDLRFFLRNERPVNALTSAMDLSTVYGVDEDRARALRSTGGKLLVGEDNLMPLNTGGFNNAPLATDEFFFAGDIRSNEHPVLTAFHTLWVREHNRIVDEIVPLLPRRVSEDIIYEIARSINGAQFQKIVFEEFYPAITGRQLPPYTGFKFFRNVAILDVFSTAGFRVGHTMVGNEVPRRGPGNIPIPAIPFTEMFFRTAEQFKDFGDFEDFLRGAMQTNAQEIDLQIQPVLRNFLFTGIEGEDEGFDLASLNLQRGRDHALPSYTAVRQRLGVPRATSFADITSNVNIQSALQSVYGTVDKVELWVGLIAEDHEPNSSFGKTMLALWERQFLNLRDGDRFFFRNNIFPSSLRNRIPTITRIFRTPELLKEIIVDNTIITRDEIPPQVFFKRN